MIVRLRYVADFTTASSSQFDSEWRKLPRKEEMVRSRIITHEKGSVDPYILTGSSWARQVCPQKSWGTSRSPT